MRIPMRTAAMAVVAAGVLAQAPAAPAAPVCADQVISGAPVLPNAVGCWNAIAVTTVRAALPYQVEGVIYMSYTQTAVYDALTKIEGRYRPYHAFAVPSGVDVADASEEAAVATAAAETLRANLPALGPDVGVKWAAYIDALRAAGTPGVDDGIAVGHAAAADLLAVRAGDRDESITFTPGPLAAGTWTFAPPPSLQSAQTPWVAVMRPFVLDRPSQFRPDPPPALSSREWALEFNEIKAYGSATSSVRSPEQTAVARFFNANAVNQVNQELQDIAAARGLDLVDAARLIAATEVSGADAGIACWDAKYTYLFWRPVMAVRNVGIDGNPATEADPNWSPLLTTPNHPEYPAAHGCVTSAEAEAIARALGTRRIDATLHGSADGTPGDFTAARTYRRPHDLEREIVDARVWAGLHYRESAVQGVALGRKVARYVARHAFAPLDD
jgi:hypothetical protein